MFEYLIPVLIFGGLMVLMHKFGLGCGGHSHAGKHGEGQHHHDAEKAGSAPQVAASSCCGGPKAAEAETPQPEAPGKRPAAPATLPEEYDGQKPIVRS